LTYIRQQRLLPDIARRAANTCSMAGGRISDSFLPYVARMSDVTSNKAVFHERRVSLPSVI
jgi:hypothetical protein